MSVIALVGAVGVGKTYFGRMLKSIDPSIIFIEEDTSKNVFLNEFYSDMQKWGFHSRISMMSMVLSNTIESIGKEKKGEIVLLDRCIEELIVFATKEYEDKNLTEKEFTLYYQLYLDLLKVLPRPDIFVYFRCNPQISFQRIKQRGRECEQNIDLDFCNDIISRYDNWRNSLVDCNVVDVNSDNGIDPNRIWEDITIKLEERRQNNG